MIHTITPHCSAPREALRAERLRGSSNRPAKTHDAADDRRRYVRHLHDSKAGPHRDADEQEKGRKEDGEEHG
jgi:hypothetical protein